MLFFIFTLLAGLIYAGYVFIGLTAAMVLGAISIAIVALLCETAEEQEDYAALIKARAIKSFKKEQ